MKVLKLFLVLSINLCCVLNLSAQDTLYWVNTNGGYFDDPNNWSHKSGEDGGAGTPDANTSVVFDNKSGLETNNDIILFEASTTYSIRSLIVRNRSFPTHFEFQGTSSSNSCEIEVYGDILFDNDDIKLNYVSDYKNTNVWKLLGDNVVHNIDTRGINMNDIILNGSNSTLSQSSALFADLRIRVEQGTWDTNGHDVEVDDLIEFRNAGGNTTALPKAFVTDGSVIRCRKYEAKLSYDLTVTGEHTFFVREFSGNPSNTMYDKVYLLEFEPPISGNVNGISHFLINNFSCVGCTVDSLIVEDSNITKINRGVIIKNMIIENTNSILYINGFNCQGTCDRSITIDGTVSGPPLGPCGQKPRMEPLSSPTVHVKTGSSGSALLTNIDVVNMPTSGPGKFNLQFGSASGSSTGWTITGQIPTMTFTWSETPSDNNWGNHKNWVGPEGCIPTLNDNVVIDDNSGGTLISLPLDNDASCNNLIWSKNNKDVEMKMNSDLIIAGHIDIEEAAEFSGNGSFILSGRDSIGISSLSRLPKLEFQAKDTDFHVLDGLNSSELYFNGGNFHTNNHDIVADSWGIPEGSQNTPMNYYLGSSSIDILGQIKFAKNNADNHIVDAGTSHIYCSRFSSFDKYEFHNLTLRNQFMFNFQNFPFSFNRLTLAGSGRVTIVDNMSVDELVFSSDDAELSMYPNHVLTVHKNIVSNASASNPALLRSNTEGTPVDIEKPNGNLCISGHIDLKDIDFITEGIAHAPDGNDVDNNTGVTFVPLTSDPNSPLYWVGNKNSKFGIPSNWSTVSGGCSANYTPYNRPSLIFDTHSTYNADRVILYQPTTTDHIIFDNVQDPFILDNRVELNLEYLTINNSNVTFLDKDIIVNKIVNISGQSILEIDNQSTSADQWYINSAESTIVVKENSVMEGND